MNATLLLPYAYLALSALTLMAQEAPITYQGRLMSGGNPADGRFDLVFSVYDAPAGGNRLCVSVTNEATAVSGGLFVVHLDFGSGVFIGPPRWLDIGIRTHGAQSYIILTPRQRMASTPYALYAPVAGVAHPASLSLVTMSTVGRPTSLPMMSTAR